MNCLLYIGYYIGCIELIRCYIRCERGTSRLKGARSVLQHLNLPPIHTAGIGCVWWSLAEQGNSEIAGQVPVCLLFLFFSLFLCPTGSLACSLSLSLSLPPPLSLTGLWGEPRPARPLTVRSASSGPHLLVWASKTVVNCSACSLNSELQLQEGRRS